MSFPILVLTAMESFICMRLASQSGFCFIIQVRLGWGRLEEGLGRLGFREGSMGLWFGGRLAGLGGL